MHAVGQSQTGVKCKLNGFKGVLETCRQQTSLSASWKIT